MPLRYRQSLRLLGGLVRLNFSRSGVSTTIKVGPFSWNSRRRRGRADLPGPFSYETNRRV